MPFQMEDLLMGMKTSRAVFQRYVDKILWSFQPRCTEVYIDDMAIFSSSMKQHLIDLRVFFERLQITNLNLDFAKYKFAFPKVKVLRYLVL